MKQLSYLAPINKLGYGVTGLNILRSLSETHSVSLWPIGTPDVDSEGDVFICRQAIENARTFNPEAPCFRVWHQNDMAQFVGKGEHVGFPIFELDTFNDVEKHHLSTLDGIVVCSEWAANVVRNNLSPKRIHISIAPLGVNTDIFKPTALAPREKTIFLNCGKWEKRKGHDVLIQAFNEAFDRHDDVELWMMCSNPFNNAEENLNWKMRYSHPKVKLIPRAATHKDVYNVMCAADAGVFPSRAEGWNLEALEMMAVGRQVIITDYSAHTEYCNEENSSLIAITEEEEAFDDKWFHGGGRWAKIGDPQIKQLANYMKEFHNAKKSGYNLYNQAGVDTAQQYTWDNTAAKMTERWA
jgi:glycosyltransferase involved in cell wall biosynthesis